MTMAARGAWQHPACQALSAKNDDAASCIMATTSDEGVSTRLTSPTTEKK